MDTKEEVIGAEMDPVNADMQSYKLKKQIISLQNAKSGAVEAPESVKKKLQTIYEEAEQEMRRSLGLVEGEETRKNETGHEQKIRDKKKYEFSFVPTY